MNFCILIGQPCPSTKLNVTSFYRELISEGKKFVENIEESEIVVFHPCKLVPLRKEIIKDIKDKKVFILSCYNEDEYSEIKNKEFIHLDNFCNKKGSFIKEKVAHVRIGYGCNHRCSYCPIKRNSSYSREIEEILEDCKEAKKIVLYGDDCASYKYGLVNLLEKLPKKEIVLTYTYPSYLLKNKKYFLENKDRISMEILPIQSASKRILKLMHRSDYNDLQEGIEFFNQLKIERVHFIFGYPTETWEDFMETVNFSKKIKSDFGRSWFLYNPYPGTKTEATYGQERSLFASEMEKYLENYITKETNKKNEWIVRFRNEKYGFHLLKIGEERDFLPMT